MQKFILYILGAGASCNVLPLSCNFASKLTQFIQDLRSAKSDQSIGPGFERNIDLYINDLEWLSNEAIKHVSVDTLAKKLFFKKDRENLKKLKSLLSSFLLMQQSSQNVDMRYDSFLATVLSQDTDGLIGLPKNLKIVTWNYDTQLEKSFYEFCANDKHVSNEITLNKDIIRVNGHCGTNKPGIIERFMWDCDKDNIIKEGTRLHREIMEGNVESKLRFAWEEQTRNILANTDMSDLSNVSAVVIIGYSFPYFNREIDDFIFLHLADTSQKKKIYLQFPEGSHASVETRILSTKIAEYIEKFVHIEHTDMFYIPDEFWG